MFNTQNPVAQTAKSTNPFATFLSGLVTAAETYASGDVATLLPYAASALAEVPADIVASKPLVALNNTFTGAVSKIVADKETLIPNLASVAVDIEESLPALIGAVAKSFLSKL